MQDVSVSKLEIINIESNRIGLGEDKKRLQRRSVRCSRVFISLSVFYWSVFLFSPVQED